LALHPTVKPVALVADAILDCSARGDIVLDAFLGSGTTLIAAERTGQRCCALELDPGYVDTAFAAGRRLPATRPSMPLPDATLMTSCARRRPPMPSVASCSRLSLPVREVNGCRSGSAELTFNHPMPLVPRG